MGQITQQLYGQRYQYAFYAIVLFYALLLGRLGLENWDTGYIPGFSWRIANGNHPYQDFIYKGPPVTLYFHALFMTILPETGQFYGIKIIGHLLFAIQVFLVASSFDRLHGLRAKGIDKWGVMCVGFIVSLLNFPCYPWPTTDGLLFAGIAFYLMSFSRNLSLGRLVAIALFCLLSALTKQSFYLVPFFFLSWIFMIGRWQKAGWFLLCLSLFFGGFLLFIAQFSSIDAFLSQTTGETHLNDLLAIGIFEYLNVFKNVYVFLGTVALSVLLVFFKSGPKFSDWRAWATWFPVALFGVAIASCCLGEILLGSRIALMAAAAALLLKLALRELELTKAFPIIVALALAWSCAVSFGYDYPVFFTTGILLSVLVLMKEDILLLMPQKYLSLLALPVVFAALFQAYRPYRERPLPYLSQSLERVSPKLAFMATSRKNQEKYLDLRQLVDRYGPDFIVAPSIPIAHYLFDSQNPLPADWLINTEVDRQYELFLTLASGKQHYIFLEKSFLEGEELSPDQPEEFSIIAWNIHRKFRPVAETKYFIVYNSVK